jgi:TolB-like protein/DNA-binding winged helix-turn-helix (wHTH) protein/Tfp pilus assembly protein PilF
MHSDTTFFRFGDITIDRENFRVQKGGRDITLSPRAFDVLALLVQNGGRVLEKQVIFDHVWKDTFVSDNALTKAVKEIRHALDDDAVNPRYIETVTKRGYRFIAEISETGRPDGQVPETASEALSAAPEPAGGHRNRLLWPIALLLLVAGASAAWFFYLTRMGQGDAAANAPIDSIAVLPFENGTQNADAAYLSDGITDSLINRLSKLSGLKVAARGAVFRYEGKSADPQRVGEELGVRSVLTGSVKQIGDQLVISVSLDDTLAKRHIWGEQYVRKFADILDVQQDIAQDVSENLRLKLSTPDAQQLARRFTQSPEAYDLYLKGQYEWKKHTQRDLQKGIDFFEQSLARDPDFALGYAALATSYAVLGNDYLPPNEAYAKAAQYAAKALSIDPDLAEAHTAMGAVRLYHDWNWPETKNELQRARAIDPNNADAHLLFGDYLDAIGEFRDAKDETRRALELDPQSAMFNTNAGIALYYAREYDAAISQLKMTIELEPRFVNAYLYLGQAYEQKNDYPKAIETFQAGIDNSERHPQLVASLGHAYALAGERAKAAEALVELENTAKERYVSPYLMAVVESGLRDRTETIKWLETAFNDRSFFMIWVNVEPQFDWLRDDPRFKRIIPTGRA